MARQLTSVTVCVGVIVVILVAANANVSSRDAVAKPAGSTARGGAVIFEFDASTLQELGWSLATGGPKEEEVGLGQPVTFQIAGPRTLRVTRGKDIGEQQVTGEAGVRGALLLMGLENRVVIGNFLIGVQPGGAWTVTNTLGRPEDQQVVFRLPNAMTDFSAANENLRVVGELSVARSWAEFLGAPEAADIVIGVMTMDIDLGRPRGVTSDRLASDSEAALFEDKGDPIGSDILIGDLYGIYYGARFGDITAYGVGTNACNIGDERASWIHYTNQHPVISQSMYRLKDDRFEQIGMSWVKHGFYAVWNSLCGPCNDHPDGDELGVGCSDPYSGYLNAAQRNMSLRSDINAHTGYFDFPWTAPSPQTLIDKRLQVHDADLDFDLNPGARYFVEGHYVHPDDCQAGTQNNNASYRPVRVSLRGRCVGGGRDGEGCHWNPAWEDRECWVCDSGDTEPGHCESDADCPGGSCLDEAICDPLVPYVFDVFTTQQTQRGQSAVRAWQDTDSAVAEIEIQVPGEGLFILAAKATHLGNGLWHYEYALQNLNSDRSAGSFLIPIPPGATVENIGFHDVDYHSGEIYDGTDWNRAAGEGSVAWWTETYDQNPNANALRFATMYNFRFDVNAGPGSTSVTIGLFKPGQPAEVQTRIIGPNPGVTDCQPNGVDDRCDIQCGSGCEEPCGGSLDCNGNGMPDECELDCNENGVADACDIRDCPPDDLSCADCDENRVPDECQGNCAQDCDQDGVPDVCDTFDDTDADGVVDCFDLCPYTTPAAKCECPPTGWCCFPLMCLPDYPRDSCIELGGRPECVEAPCRDGCPVTNIDKVGDLVDVLAFTRCFSGPSEGRGYQRPRCICLARFDFDDDDDIDGDDYSLFWPLMAGP